MTRIFILTYCKDIKNLYGNLLTFKTVRKGFKDAEIIVYDNNSIDEARKEFRDAVKSIDAKYIQYSRDVAHHDFIKHQIENNQDCSRIIFLDPDLVFWDNFDNFESNHLIVGRKIPSFFDSVTKTKTFERLHTSFLIINKPKKLLEKLKSIEDTYQNVMFYRPYMFMRDNEWYMFDSLGALYNALRDDCGLFTETELDKYDHLFCGTHLDVVKKNNPNHSIIQIHKLAMDNIDNIKGLWREQEKFLLQNKF